MGSSSCETFVAVKDLQAHAGGIVTARQITKRLLGRGGADVIAWTIQRPGPKSGRLHGALFGLTVGIIVEDFLLHRRRILAVLAAERLNKIEALDRKMILIESEISSCRWWSRTRL